MKCEKCGAEIKLEQLYCPYCGTPNKEARQHAKDMQDLKADYSETKKQVYRTNAFRTRLTVKIVVIVVLFIAIFLTAGIDPYDIQRNQKEREFNKNKDTIIKTLNEALENGDYLKVDQLADEYSRNLRYGHTEYQRATELCGYYVDALELFGKLFNNENRSDNSYMATQLEYDLKNTAKYLDGTRNVFDSSYDPIPVSDTDLKIAASIDALFKHYLKMTDEELDAVKELSEAQQTAQIETRLTEIYGESERTY